MLFNFSVDPSLDLPIYAQLIDIIRTQIRTGTIAKGEKLPTVRELGEKCGIAPGTVMRAYSELESTGYIEKAPGKGTFACWMDDTKLSSRKEAALNAIDRMLDEMESLHFSPAETGIFLELKLRERHEGNKPVRIALVEKDGALMVQLTECLAHLRDVSVSPFQLQDVLSFPYHMGDDIEIIVGREECLAEVSQDIPDPGRLLPLILRLDGRTSCGIAAIGDRKQGLILCESMETGNLLRRECQAYFGFEEMTVLPYGELGGSVPAGTSAVLLYDQEERSLPEEEQAALRRAIGDVPVVRCTWVPDGGSLSSLESRIASCRKSREFNSSLTLMTSPDSLSR